MLQEHYIIGFASKKSCWQCKHFMCNPPVIDRPSWSRETSENRLQILHCIDAKAKMNKTLTYSDKLQTQNLITHFSSKYDISDSRDVISRDLFYYHHH